MYWYPIMIERIVSKANYTTLTLSLLTMRHLVPYLHCNLVACQQQVHVTSHIRYKGCL